MLTRNGARAIIGVLVQIDRFKVISTHKTSGAHLDTSHNYSWDRDESARHVFRPATNSATIETELCPGRDEQKQVSPSRVTLF